MASVKKPGPPGEELEFGEKKGEMENTEGQGEQFQGELGVGIEPVVEQPTQPPKSPS